MVATVHQICKYGEELIISKKADDQTVSAKKIQEKECQRNKVVFLWHFLHFLDDEKELRGKTEMTII